VSGLAAVPSAIDPLVRSGAIRRAAESLGHGPLTEAALARHVHPLFSRVLRRAEIYLSNHSLGRPPDQTALDLAEFAESWTRDMDDAWPAWLHAQGQVRAMIARLIGVSRPDAVVPRVSAGQGLRAVLNSLNGVPRVLASRGEFDSVDFILKAYHARGRAVVNFVELDERRMVSPARVVDTLNTGKPHALVIVSQIYYLSGQVLDGLEAIVRAARARGTLVLIDMYHAMGVVPCAFESLGADFAIGGNYKYTRGGPGAGWLAVHPRHLSPGPTEAPPTLDTGWFAKEGTFGFERPEAPLTSAGGDAWLECTPAPVLAYQARAGLEFVLAIGVGRLREYSVGQQEFLAAELARRAVPIDRIEPRGAFLLMPCADAPAMVMRLKRAGVNTDSRLGRVRLCPDVLNTREELARAAEIIAREMSAP